MIRWPYIQSSAMDVLGTRRGAVKALQRFEALDAELAKIGARRKPGCLQVHDEMNIEIDCPKGHEYEARLILAKYFPST